jgi:hypothetical protein
MFVDPSAGNRFQGVHVIGQVISNPEWQPGACIREDMVCFIEKGLSVSGIAFEKSEYSEGQQNEKSDGESRQGRQGH